MKAADLEMLAGFAADSDIGRLPADIVDKARSCLLYGLAVGAASAGTAPARAAIRGLDGEADVGAVNGSTRLLDGAPSAAGAAAFANAVMLHARCQEDAHPAGHIGVVVLPAALAVAERQRSTGAELLAAIVAGYEVALRIGRDHAADLSLRGFRTTPAYGVFGAAAAAARLLRLRGPRIADAIGLAANAAGGLRDFVEAGTEEFPFHAGFAARNGITAASLAAAGVHSSRTALGGAAGFYAAFAGNSPEYAARLVEDLGAAFEMRTIAYKPYPTCQFHRGIVRGLCALRGEAAGADVAGIEIRLHPIEADFWGVRFAGPYRCFPQTFMSAPFCAALAWTRGAVSFAGLHDFADPAVHALLPLIEIVADAARARYQPLLVVRLAGRRTLRWEETAGAGAYALDWAVAERMTRALCAEAGVVGPPVDRLIAAVAAIDRAPHVGAVVGALREIIAAAVSAPRET